MESPTQDGLGPAVPMTSAFLRPGEDGRRAEKGPERIRLGSVA